MLRTLNRLPALALSAACFSTLSASAQSDALGDDLRLSIARALDDAKDTGLSLRARIEILKRAHDLPDGVARAGIDALQNSRVQELLGLGALEALGTGEVDADRYPQGVFVFASFSMPGPALRQLLTDASDMGVPVVFNGFVKNSAFETEQVLRTLFAEPGTSHGFLIDPSLFTRFAITAVPAVVTTLEVLDVCLSAGCIEDAAPVHDRVYGNIPLASALRIIARGNGDAPGPAIAALGDRL